MKNRIFTLLLSFCIAASGASFVFAGEGDVYNNLDKKYMSDYSINTTLSDDLFTPQQFTVKLSLNDVAWLGDVRDKVTAITIKTGAKQFRISDKLPNLKKLVKAQILAKASFAGNTFTCRNIPDVSWNDRTGTWQTVIDAPKDRISYALDELEKQLTITEPGMRDAGGVSFFDNMILIKPGTRIEYDDTVITINKDCEIDELYDGIKQENYHDSTFAENIFRIKEYSTTTEDGNGISLTLAKGTFIQIAEKRFTAKNDITIKIENATINKEVPKNPLKAFSDAIATAENTGEGYGDENHPGEPLYVDHELFDDCGMNDIHPSKYCYIHKCDADAVFSSAFGVLNELLGVMAQKDAKIVVVPTDDETVADPVGRNPESGASVSAELRVVSEVPCSHEHKKVVDKIAATIMTMGYTGDTYCEDCGLLLSNGSPIAKLPTSIKLSKTTVNMKTGKTDSSVKVTFVSGDSIKSVTSSNTSIVKAEKSGANGIKLTALKKVGTATVTVKLKAGKSAKITVKVTSTPCSKLVLKSKSSVTLKKGKSHQIKVTRKPSACVQKITYKSSNKKVAAVTSKGKVTAKKKGTAKITIKCGTKTKTVKIRVK